MTDTETSQKYPSIRKAVQAIFNEERFPNTGVRRLEVNVLAGGDVSYRVFIVGQEEPEDGALPEPVS